MSLLKRAPTWVLTALLLLHGAAFYGVSREENPPEHRALSEFPSEVGAWTMYREGVFEEAVQEVLQADDTLVRFYREGATQGTASLHIAYFQSQRTGVNPHSPKHCLPGVRLGPDGY